MPADSLTLEMNPALDAITRLSTHLTTLGFEKVTIQFSGQQSTPVLEEPKFFRTGLEDAVPLSDVVAAFGGMALDSAILTDLAARALSDKFPYWSDFFGAYGVVSYYPSVMGTYISIQKMVLTSDECSLTRNSVEALYPKAKAV